MQAARPPLEAARSGIDGGEHRATIGGQRTLPNFAERHEPPTEAALSGSFDTAFCFYFAARAPVHDLVTREGG
jgi:hypothetical protein